MFVAPVRFVYVHPLHSTSFENETQPLRIAVLLGSMTTPTRDFVDALGLDCHYQKCRGNPGFKQFTTGAPGLSPGGND